MDATDRAHRKLVILTNYVPPPRLPVFQAIARELQTTILVDTLMEANRQWPVEHRSLPVKPVSGFTLKGNYQHPSGFSEQNFLHLPFGLLWQLPRERPTHILSGELGVRSGIACLYRLLKPSIRLTLWVEGTPHTDGPRGRLRTWWRKLILRVPDTVVATSSAARNLLLSYGVRAEKIVISLQASGHAAPTTPPTRSDAERRRLLFCGRLAQGKGLQAFVPALRAVCEEEKGLSVEFWFAGHGEEEAWLRAQRLPNEVSLTFLGHVPYTELPRVYRQCGILVFPTLADVWGLVVNEAMCHSMPVLGSRYSAAVCELVEEGKTGWTFFPDRPAEVAAAIRSALQATPAELEHMGEWARKRVEQLTAERFGRDLLEAVLRDRPKPSPRLAILTNFVPPTRVPSFERIAGAIDTTILVDTPMEDNRPWLPYSGSLRVELTPGWSFRRRYKHPRGWREDVYYHIPYGLLWRLARLKPTHVLSGELGFRTAFACLYRLLRPSIRLAVVASGTPHTDRHRGRLRMWWRKLILRIPDAVVATSKGAADLVTSYGVSPAKVTVSSLVSGLSPPENPPARDVRQRRRLLYCGRLVPLKGLRGFLLALDQVCEESSARVELWVAGSGEEEEWLRSFRGSSGIAFNLLGAVPYQELPRVYQQCGILVFPTLCDVWGVVVNEAMAYSMPVLGSRYAQAVCDLVEDGKTGWTFRPDNHAEMADAIRRALSATYAELECMGNHAREKALEITPEKFAEDLLAAALGNRLSANRHQSSPGGDFVPEATTSRCSSERSLKEYADDQSGAAE